MQYVGGKFRSASGIAAAILERSPVRDVYVEPFLGGAAVAAKLVPHFRKALLSDVVPDLIAMWQEACVGWIPPSLIDEAQYAALRNATTSPLRGFVGFGCSFGGKWFGGYARAHNGAAPGYNYAAGASRGVVKQAAAMAGAEIQLSDYRDLDIPTGATFYADPPYRGVTGYGASAPFDSDEFWKIAQGWVDQGANVFVSEHCAPDDWVEVWRKPLPNYLRGTGQVAGERTERLFVPR